MTTFIYPSVKRVTSGFGPRKHPLTGKVNSMHNGVDFAQSGTHHIKASAAGTVTRAQVMGTYGNIVMIVHNINGEIWETAYAHLRSYSVRVGQKVAQGQLIGIMGNTGNSTGQHLHFELHRGRWASGQRNAVDPLKYLGKDLTPKLAVDGNWGPATTRRAQEVYGLAIVDSVVSGQEENSSTRNIPSAKFGSGGSNLIRAMQKEFGVPIRNRDGRITVPSMLVRAMQGHYNTVLDSKLSSPSLVIKEWQKVLNKGRRK